MTKAQFQEAHGSAWSKIVAEPAFFSALQVCGAERLREIENLSAAEIETNGKVHLANFQGHLKTESILLGLAIEAQGGGFDLPTANYNAPIPGEDQPEQAEQPVSFPIFEQQSTPPKPQKKPKKRTKRK